MAGCVNSALGLAGDVRSGGARSLHYDFANFAELSRADSGRKYTQNIPVHLESRRKPAARRFRISRILRLRPLAGPMSGDGGQDRRPTVPRIYVLRRDAGAPGRTGAFGGHPPDLHCRPAHDLSDHRTTRLSSLGSVIVRCSQDKSPVLACEVFQRRSPRKGGGEAQRKEKGGALRPRPSQTRLAQSKPTPPPPSASSRGSPWSRGTHRTRGRPIRGRCRSSCSRRTGPSCRGRRRSY